MLFEARSRALSMLVLGIRTGYTKIISRLLLNRSSEAIMPSQYEGQFDMLTVRYLGQVSPISGATSILLSTTDCFPHNPLLQELSIFQISRLREPCLQLRFLAAE